MKIALAFLAGAVALWLLILKAPDLIYLLMVTNTAPLLGN